MIQDYIVTPGVHPDRIFLLTGNGTRTAPQMTYDHVVGSHLQLITPQAHPVSQRRLPCQRQKGAVDPKGTLQVNNSSHPENYNARTLRPTRRAQTAWSGII